VAPAPQVLAQDDVRADVAALLAVATQAHGQNRPAPWQGVLPIYPTSPVALS
jgi:hypothetical protein